MSGPGISVVCHKSNLTSFEDRSEELPRIAGFRQDGLLMLIGRDLIEMERRIRSLFVESLESASDRIDTVCNRVDPFFRIPWWNTLLKVSLARKHLLT